VQWKYEVDCVISLVIVVHVALCLIKILNHYVLHLVIYQRRYTNYKLQNHRTDIILNQLEQGCTTFYYCRPHYFYLYEVRPPRSSCYIYEIRLIKE